MSLAARSCSRLAARRALAPVRIGCVGMQQRRWESAAAAPVDAKISGIVDQISKLTLMETADLVSALKSKLNIPDVALQSFAAPAAAAAPVVEEVEDAPVAAVKTMFNVKLVKFDAAAKPKIIKEVKALLGLSLVDSKKFVESAPKMLKEQIVKEDAEKIQKTLQDLGAEVVLE